MTLLLVVITLINVAIAWATRRHTARIARAHKRILAARDEITLVVVENERLRREGVWNDDGVWRGRLTVAVEAPTANDAGVALVQAIAAAAATYRPGRPVQRAN